jgi:hypothetical protein
LVVKIKLREKVFLVLPESDGPTEYSFERVTSGILHVWILRGALAESTKEH